MLLSLTSSAPVQVFCVMALATVACLQQLRETKDDGAAALNQMEEDILAGIPGALDEVEMVEHAELDRHMQELEDEPAQAAQHVYRDEAVLVRKPRKK